MSKQAISLTLAAENLLWLRGQARAAGRRSVSDLVDQLVSDVRKKGGQPGTVRSVVGTVRIDPADPDLTEADAAVRTLFAAWLGHSGGTRTSGRRPPRSSPSRGRRGA